MPPSIDALRDKVVAEVLKTTNKPRFCYMGYAPPLCIGDEYVKRRPKEVSAKPMLVSCPSVLFSSFLPLCLGDGIYTTPKPKIPESDRPSFKPSGTILSSPVAYLQPKPLESAKKPLTRAASSLGFYVATTNALFHPKIEAMSSLSQILKKKSTEELSPFRVSYGSSQIFSQYGHIASPPPCLVRSKKTPLVPFVPAGHCNSPSLGPVVARPITALVEPALITDDRPSWKATGLPLLSSPTASVAMNPLNLLK